MKAKSKRRQYLIVITARQRKAILSALDSELFNRLDLISDRKIMGELDFPDAIRAGKEKIFLEDLIATIHFTDPIQEAQ